MKKTLLMTMALCALLTVGACSDDSGGLSVASLEGTWFGAGRDLFGDGGLSSTYGTINITMDGSGGISGSETVTPASFSGTYYQESGQVFGFDLSDGTVGGFISDSGGNYAVFATEDAAFGVVEKDASSLPTYVEADIVGSWSGIGVATDFVDFTQGTSEATVTSSGSLSGSNSTGDTFTGSIPSFGPSIGFFNFSFVNSVEGSGFGQVFLSADKTFAGSWGCTGSCVFPDDIGFTSWTKQ